MVKKEKRIVIIGAGPCGLGAAYRLRELGYHNFSIYEKNRQIGGISASFKDNKGFVWDQGGHVIFSHYVYFDRLMDKLLGRKYTEHLRECWIWVLNRFVPYPFQNNIRYLPEMALLECLYGLYQAQNHRGTKNFCEWILRNFGHGIAKYFMWPYNFKVWATPLKKMSSQWIKERVSVIDFNKILQNVILKKDEVSWGPNNKFKFPLNGGTGGLFSAFMPYIRKNLSTNKEVIKIDVQKKTIYFNDNSKDGYDSLISTIPLDHLIKISTLDSKYKDEAIKLQHNSVYVIGIGIKGKCPSKKCWVYFPEKSSPFYRLTFFSNYSPKLSPSKKYYSLMCEISESKNKKVNKKTIVNQTINGLINSKIIRKTDKKNIMSRFLYKIPYAYPIPTLGRDKILKKINFNLKKNNIYSRGRFGAWRYEIGNMDHTTMQGVEVVDRILLGKKERTLS